jgi:murein DD-endopeptidase MepM/ murein hydrolase activator NlpD
VVEGDVVTRGSTIAKVGSTGWSTGNHLHFGIQVGGTWIDPMTKTER